jgi:hypothetical protein
VVLGSEQLGWAKLVQVDDPGSDPAIQALLAELEQLEEGDDPVDTEAVSARLWNATGLLSVKVLWSEQAPSDSVQKLNPLWGCLLARYHGMVQADHEGYYDTSGLVLELG